MTAVQEETEIFQNMVVMFVTSNYRFETGSMTGILDKLRLEPLKKRGTGSSLISLYKGLKGPASIPTDDFISPIRSSRNHHLLTFQTPTSRINIYQGLFFRQTIGDLNALPDSIISSSEGAEDGVARFTSLVRARD